MKNFIFISFLLTSNSFAQQYHFRNFSVEDGLAQMQVGAITQDAHGYMWFGTFSGWLSRYDGFEFVNFSDRETGIDHAIAKLAADRQGNVWITTQRNLLVKFNGSSFSDAKKYYGLPDTLKIAAILADIHGTLWLGTEKHGLLRISPGSEKWAAYDTTNGLPSNHIQTLYEDLYGNIWASTDKEFGRIDISTRTQTSLPVFTAVKTNGNNFSVNAICTDKAGNLLVSSDIVYKITLSENNRDVKMVERFTTPDGIVINGASHIITDRDGSLWCTTSNGVSRYQETSNMAFHCTPVEKITMENGLCNNNIWTAFTDREGSVWFGTLNGISKFEGDRFVIYGEKEGIPPSAVMSVSLDRQGNLWTGTWGGGAARVNLTGQGEKDFLYFNDKNGFNNTVYALFTDSKGVTWFGPVSKGIFKYNGGVITHYPLNEMHNQEAFSFCEDKKGNIWAGVVVNGIAMYYRAKDKFFYYTKAEGLKGIDVVDIMEDRDENIWIATRDSGISRLTFDNDYHIRSAVHLTEKDGLASNRCYSVAEDFQGNIWINPLYKGLDMYHLREKKFEHFDVADGLSSNTVYLIIFDRRGDLWIGTNKGLDKLDVEKYYATGEKHFKHYGKAEGFLPVETDQNACFMDSTGNLWFGTVKGVVKYNPKKDVILPSPPLLHIREIDLFFEKTDWSLFSDSISQSTGLPVNLSLPHFKNHLTFHFAGLTYVIPEKVQYSYKLEGLDEEWSPPSSIRKAVYSNIPPGEYTFMVKSCNADGVWNSEPVAYDFEITPPFWQTLWFRITCFLLLTAGIWSYINYRERSLKEQKRVLEEKVDERTKELKEEKDKVKIQKEEIELRNVLITDSIDYAKRIQDAALSPPDQVKSCFPDSFVLLKPKDVVSGDFFWMHRQNGNIMLAAADCTGHGVPGAFMSIICNNILNNIVTTQNSLTPGTILKLMSEQLINRLKQREGEGVLKDGLDIALISISPSPTLPEGKGDKTVQPQIGDGLLLQYAGAHNPLYIISNGELSEIKADKLFIGITEDASDITFTEHSVKLKKGDCIYVFSDGFADQKGGPKGKKFYYPPFKQLLIDIHQKSMEEQKEALNNTIEKWKDKREQMDDILVIGIRI